MHVPPDRDEQRLEGVVFRRLGMLAKIASAGLAVVVLSAALVAMGFVAGSWAVSRIVPGPSLVSANDGHAASPSKGSKPDTATAVVATADADAAPGSVEVPDVRGQRVDAAVVLLQASGFTVAIASQQASAVAAPHRLVSTQSPLAGTVAAAESTITLTAPPLAPTPTGSTTATRSAAAFVVCIDPGHQTHNDEKLEPIGPGSKTESARATGGFTGVATGLPEYEIDLELGARLKKRLVAQGVHVVMTRTANDVQLSNAERAKIANRAHADLFVRIHCSASTVATDSGLSVLFPAKNRWTASIASSSQAAARFIESSAVHASGARNRGAHSQAGVVGFNWSKVPAVMVQAGFLSNPIEDKLLATPSYQDHLATGLADGILAYLRQKAKK